MSSSSKYPQYNSVKYQALGVMYRWRHSHLGLMGWAQACPGGISWLSQLWFACRLSAVNVLLNVCHVSPYWRSEVEWNHSSAVCKGGKGRVKRGSVVCAGWRELFESRSVPSPLFPHTQEIIFNVLLFQREGDEWEGGGNVYHTLAFCVQESWEIQVCGICYLRVKIKLTTQAHKWFCCGP